MKFPVIIHPSAFIAAVLGGLLFMILLGRLSAKPGVETVYKTLVVSLSLILFWEVVLYLGVFKSILLAPPSTILTKTFYFLGKGYLQMNIVATLSRFLVGFSIALLLAIPLGMILGFFRKAYEWTIPPLNFIRMIPPPALLPFAIVLLGIGERPAVFMIALGCFFPIFFNTVQGVRETESIYVEVIKTMGGSRKDILRYAIIPSALPFILTGIRIGSGIGWLVLVSSEIVAADSGLGFMIEGARNRLETPTIFVGMATVCVLGLAIDFFFKKAEKAFTMKGGGGFINYSER